MRPTIKRDLNNGTQEIYKFNNSYGASVVCHEFSYGGEEGFKELAVLKFGSDNPLEFNLVYDTPITTNVLGWLSNRAVKRTLWRIKNHLK